jgi:phage terminase small subunit
LIVAIRADRKTTAAFEEAFVQEFLVDFSATDAFQRAERCKDNRKAANAGASRLMAKPRMKEMIRAALDKRAEKVEVTKDDVLSGLQIIREYAMRVEKRVSGKERMVDPAAAIRALELLGKTLSLFTDKVEHQGRVCVLSDADIERRIKELTSDDDAHSLDL